MKHTIGNKILLVILAPFLMIFAALSIYITYMVFQYVTNWTELEIKGISEINAAELEGKIYSVQVSVQSAADSLAIIDSDSENGRTHAETIIQSMFENEHIYNAWLACEPNAFDGRDSEHKYDYPGSPSGRFIRSYIMEEGQIITAPDMDDITLDDPVISPWYTVPRDSGSLYIDVNNENPNLYDYGVGGDPVYTLSVVAPIFKDGRVIGCAGADVIFLEMTFGIDNGSQAAVAVFYPDGRIFFSQDLEYAEESVDTLGFTQTRQIKDALLHGKSLFLPDEYSVFLDTGAFTYFQPVNTGADGQDNLYLYVATPRAEAFDSLRPLIILISAIFIVTIFVVLAIILYVKSVISKPIMNLTLAADAISQGNLETEIEVFSNEQNEIGAMARSLHRMVSQFRIYISRMEQAQEEMTVHTQIWELINESDSVTRVFGRFSEMLCRHMNLNTVTAVYMSGASAVVRGSFTISDSHTNRSVPRDFTHHHQVESLISGKKLVFLNSFAISAQDLQFTEPGTTAVCIVPMRCVSKLYGYLILERSDKNASFGEGEESLLTYIAQILADWLLQLEKPDEESEPGQPESLEKSAQPQEAGEPDGFSETSGKSAGILSAILEVGGLDIGSSLGDTDEACKAYERSIAAFVRLVPEIAGKLDAFIGLVSDNNAEAFVTELSVLITALKDVRATAQTKFAERLEKAASSGDTVFCERNYPIFRAGLLKLHGNVKNALENRFTPET